MIEIRPASLADAAAIAAIYNQGIAARSATFEVVPRRSEDIEQRIADPQYPVLVATNGGTVAGWAGLSSYRPRECYAGIAEFSFYVEAASRGRGYGKQLLQALIVAARERGFWKLVSRIFPFNEASLTACRALGFREVGIYEKHGQLDGHWLDVVIVERLIPENLATPPVAAGAAAVLSE
ncbi:MAG TPA: arsinothricin resistance N-acetyltransferase ArsN1 family A [Rhodanobacteraceae bacterium]|nr:arsinothricin resistance N-acetyltransferase ArsN1 family A [Rhodanobacteraceae bacterium]